MNTRVFNLAREIESKRSYSGGNVEHGTTKPLGNALLVAYDNASYLNKIYCTDSQWLYQYYRD